MTPDTLVARADRSDQSGRQETSMIVLVTNMDRVKTLSWKKRLKTKAKAPVMDVQQYDRNN